jgi:hypothetical protein
VSSSREKGVLPEGLEGLEQPVRLNSSHYKGLMPCYEIIAAGTHSDRAAALAHSEALRAEGIDNYAKASGAYVGEDPRLKNYCETPQTPCETPFRFVETYEKTPYMHLSLDSVTAERALSEAPSPTRIGDLSVWRTPLSAESIDDWSVGQALAGQDEAGSPQTCTLESFVALTRGTPHFGWYDDDQSKPGCGEPEVFAVLSCSGPAHIMAPETEESWIVSKVSDDPLPPEVSGAGIDVLKRDPAYKRAFSQAKGEATNRGVDLQEAIEVRQVSHDKHTFLRVTSHLTTGEGLDSCGGDDVNLVVSGVVTGPSEPRPGEVVIPFREMGEAKIDGLVDLGDDSLGVLETRWPQRTAAITSGGDTLCAIEVDFCDCAC